MTDSGQHPTHHAEPAATTALTASRGLERIWAATGALTVALFAGGLVFGDLLGSANYRRLDASNDQVRRYSWTTAPRSAR